MKKTVFLLFLFFRSFAFAEKTEDLSFPYNTINILPQKWNHCFVNQKQLDEIFENNAIHVVVDVGSGLGESAIYMAKKLPSFGKLYAIDQWKGSIGYTDSANDADFSFPTLYEQFLSNVIHEELTQKIIPIRKETNEIVKTFNGLADLIYINASNDKKNVYNVIKQWYEKLSYNGIICGDARAKIEVRQAIERFAQEYNLQIYVKENFWSLSPKKFPLSEFPYQRRRNTPDFSHGDISR